jgi:hypothetical protein
MTYQEPEVTNNYGAFFSSSLSSKPELPSKAPGTPERHSAHFGGSSSPGWSPGALRHTSSYFEGAYTQSDIVTLGYNRDGKRGHEQMVIALRCSAEGCPVGVEVFAGNTQDASTVSEKIAQLQRQSGLKEIIFVGDRGMITKTVADKIKGIEGLHTISALTHRQIVELLERKVITAELFDEEKIVEVFDPEEPKRRYCLCRNPLTAGREGKMRERLLERARAQLDKIAGSKRRASAKTLGARVGRVLERSKMGKFVRWDLLDGRLSWNFNQDKIVAEKLFDGCYIVSIFLKSEICLRSS